MHILTTLSAKEYQQSFTINPEIAARVNECVLATRRITIGEISNELDFYHGSVYKIIGEQLKFHKFCARYGLYLLMVEHKESVLKMHLNFYNITKRTEMSF